MARARKNEGRSAKILHLDPTSLEIIDRYCYHTGTNSKCYLEACVDLVAERIKKEHPEALYKPRPDRIASISEFTLPNEARR